MLEHALVRDASGAPLEQDEKSHSRDWDEVQEFCRKVYMPYQARPLLPRALPDGPHHLFQVFLRNRHSPG